MYKNELTEHIVVYPWELGVWVVLQYHQQMPRESPRGWTHDIVELVHFPVLFVLAFCPDPRVINILHDILLFVLLKPEKHAYTITEKHGLCDFASQVNSGSSPSPRLHRNRYGPAICPLLSGFFLHFQTIMIMFDGRRGFR